MFTNNENYAAVERSLREVGKFLLPAAMNPSSPDIFTAKSTPLVHSKQDKSYPPGLAGFLLEARNDIVCVKFVNWYATSFLSYSTL